MEGVRSTRLPLRKLPIDLLLPIMRKMNTKTLIRLRSTCSAMNTFVERNRLGIQTRSDGVPNNLSITIHPLNKPLFFVINRYFQHETNLFCEPIDILEGLRKTSLIEDPICTLSGVRFDTVVVKQPLKFESAADVRDSFFKLLPVLMALRLSTERLCLDEVEENLQSLFFAHVTFTNFNCSKNNMRTADIRNYPIQTCSDICLKTFSRPTESLTECIGLSQNVLFEVGDVDDAKLWFSDFLNDIRSDSTSKKNLQILKLRTGFATDWGVHINETNGLKLLGCLPPLGYGYVVPYPIGHEFFWKMEISGGYAYVWNRGCFTEMIFKSVDCQESVFLWMCSLVFQRFLVFDLSDAYDAYKSGKNPKEAVERIREFRDVYMERFYNDPNYDIDDLE